MTEQSSKKKFAIARGPLMLVVITVLLAFIGLKVTGFLGVMDADEWIADYTGIFLGLLAVILMGAVGAAILILFKKVFGGRKEPRNWETLDETMDD